MTSRQFNGDRPGEKMYGASYAHRFSLYFGEGWSDKPEKRAYEFKVVGHYTDNGSGHAQYPRFSVEHVEVETLPHMDREGMANLLNWLRRGLAQVVEIEITNLRRDMLLEVEKVA